MDIPRGYQEAGSTSASHVSTGAMTTSDMPHFISWR
jgi:hypothetical protein